MTTFDLASIGLTQEELQDRVVQRIADAMLTDVFSDEDGRGHLRDSTLKRKLDAMVQERIDAAVTAIGDAHVLPIITANLETLVLQKTNEWGEKRGKGVSFVEYLVQRADAYMSEPVNYEGKPKQKDSYQWSAHGTRIGFAIDRHLQYSIDRAMTEALATANSSIVNGLQEAVKTSLGRIVTGLKVATETKAR